MMSSAEFVFAARPRQHGGFRRAVHHALTVTVEARYKSATFVCAAKKSNVKNSACAYYLESFLVSF
jgi:hypothetical protein